MPAEDEGPGRRERRKMPWVLPLLVLAVITSSSLSVLSMYHVLALHAEVEGLGAEVVRRRQELSGIAEELVKGPQKQHVEEHQTEADYADTSDRLKKVKRSVDGESDAAEIQSCLQMMADNTKQTFQKEFALDACTAVPWQVGLKRGSALEEQQGSIIVKEEGFFFIYSQVYYTDSTFAMGHIIIRIKKNIVGDESQNVVLFRCIQSMNRVNHFNTCFTAGVVKLDSGDRLELLIPRSNANISLDGDSTFLGAIKLA